MFQGNNMHNMQQKKSNNKTLDKGSLTQAIKEGSFRNMK